jgi:hypothetical protein
MNHARIVGIVLLVISELLWLRIRKAAHHDMYIVGRSFALPSLLIAAMCIYGRILLVRGH